MKWNWLLLVIGGLATAGVLWYFFSGRANGGGGLVTKIGASGSPSTGAGALPPADLTFTLDEVDAAMATFDASRVR